MRSASILVSLPLVIPQVLAGFLGGEHLFTTVIKRVQLWYNIHGPRARRGKKG